VAGARARLFFALWPDAAVGQALGALARELARVCSGRAVPAANVHLTLAFLGELERERLAPLAALARTVRGEPFALELNRLDYWRHNRIVWAGTETCPAPLAALAAELGAGLRGLGIAIEERPYVPHITLVRDARRAPPPGRAPGIRWPVRAFALVESVPRGHARAYEVLESWRLE
jgi:2'-5' RNA ligase